ncbi:hypothetical protein [Streptomyces justiciae]|uniref:hypothetical protein n=1 Tax=Streptomyces justiciae TaxID=2780140 RepID=UPI001D13D951|nr:hypothetical protein [Streptomyces justiciae]MCW8384573.1 hypothetical protein [Streptomyces justiciae]
MTRHDRFGRPAGGPSPATTSPAGRRPGGHRPARPALSLVPGTRADAPVELSTLTRQPMPADVRGAIVTPVHGALMATWMPLDGPSRVPQGRILLAWTPAGDDRTDVTAHLGLAGAQVLLAVWPGLRGDWTGVVRPTVAEVTELHAALRLATVVLDRLTD